MELDANLESQIAHMPGVVGSVAKKATAVGADATENLSTVRATTTHVKFDQETAHQTKIEVTHGEVDSFVTLHAPDAMALEFGHDPSGAFGPGRSNRYTGDKRKGTYNQFQVMSQVGKFGKEPSKAPEGQYILYRAAGLI